MNGPEARIARICGSPVVSLRRFAGGDISGASAVTLADGRRVVAKKGPVAAIEGRMLAAMARSGAPVPAVLGSADDVLVMERLPEVGPLEGRAWDRLADALAALHGLAGPAYGWDEDYALRQVAVENARWADWAEFWAARRLLCHAPHVAPELARRIERLAASLPDLLPATPVPSLLHGDLWGGNILVSGNRVSGLIDPCAYHGDREVDAATLTVFDHPPARFFAALDLEPGWRERQPAYRLWTWLVHLRLFGEAYRGAVEGELDTLGC